MTDTPDFGFRVVGQDGNARLGIIDTPRGRIRTPAFMPVGTAGTVKAVYFDQLQELGTDVILGNTYHLMLRPGAERIARLGGLNRFIGWPGPILTDSGGFQVMSLAKLRHIDERGVTFASHIDGSRHELCSGDSVTFDADLPHHFENEGDEPTRFLAVIAAGLRRS